MDGNYKLYSRAFWIFLPNVIKIDQCRPNFELYRFKVGAFFETQCISTVHIVLHWLLPLLWNWIAESLPVVSRRWTTSASGAACYWAASSEPRTERRCSNPPSWSAHLRLVDVHDTQRPTLRTSQFAATEYAPLARISRIFYCRPVELYRCIPWQ